MAAKRRRSSPRTTRTLYTGDMGKQIKEKLNRIEKEIGESVIMEMDNNQRCKACVDFSIWDDSVRSRLPKVKYKYGVNRGIDRIHILHELIHLEMFFIERYRIIGCTDQASLQAKETEANFKNVSEDYVAHKVIRGYRSGFGSIFDPIDEKWFSDRMNMTIANIIDSSKTDLDIAVMLVQFDNYSEFRKAPKYKEKAMALLQSAKDNREKAYIMAERALSVLAKINYENNQSYNSQLDLVIDIFAPGYSSVIRPFLLEKRDGIWELRP